MSSTRTKEERLISLNSRLEWAKTRLSMEKKQLFNLQDEYRNARGKEDAVKRKMAYSVSDQYPENFDQQALGKARKAMEKQREVVEVLEGEVSRIANRIEEVKSGN